VRHITQKGDLEGDLVVGTRSVEELLGANRGPPWWFFDSPLGIRRYFDQVLETAGLYNTVGFNDDTRAFASIPSRHDVWRRVSCDWLAGLVVQGLLAEDEAHEMAHGCAYGGWPDAPIVFQRRHM
jgi:glucuronate isomerase